MARMLRALGRLQGLAGSRTAPALPSLLADLPRLSQVGSDVGPARGWNSLAGPKEGSDGFEVQDQHLFPCTRSP